MLSYKRPEAEVRLHYPRRLELGFVLALLLVGQMFLLSKNTYNEIVIPRSDSHEFVPVDIPLTVQRKTAPPPERPTIPIEDPEVPIEDEIPFMDLTDVKFGDLAPPPPPPVEMAEDLEFWAVEQKPVMVGGPSALYQYIATHNLYPEMALESGLPGAVLIGFVVDEQGCPVDVHVIDEEPIGMGFGEAGVTAVSAMTFTPGMQRDRAVRVKMTQGIRFQVK